MRKSSGIDGVPTGRITLVNEAAPNPAGRFVLYWMNGFRRTNCNFALERAVELAKDLGKPLLIAETLDCSGRWASDRHHAFVLQGMADNKRACEARNVRYYPFVERRRGQVESFVAALAASSCAVVTDDFPMKPAVRALQQLGNKIDARMERVDSNGLLPLQATDRVFPTAYAFRRFLQKSLPDHLLDAPRPNPFARMGLPKLRGVPSEIRKRWPEASARLLAAEPASLAQLPIDHRVHTTGSVGGPRAAQRILKNFLANKLSQYPELRNHPDADGSSNLSAYLHYGHISVFEIFHQLAKAEGWSPGDLAETATGKRHGWWNMSPAAEEFLDELVTWREVGFNFCSHSDQYDQFESLPDWAQITLSEHATDPREHVYSDESFEQGQTHDRLWNAAQRQLVDEGRVHNYVRMLWGKKILEWSATPRDALETMVQLNNKFALDGQDPNSYSGIFWILGRYDRPWGPERPIFGKIRYMSSENTARKLPVKEYLDRYAPPNRD